MQRSSKQSILLSGKLSDNKFDIRYFSTGLKFGRVILSWMEGAIVSQSWQKITFLPLSGLNSTFSEELSRRKVSNNYWWPRGSDWTPWTRPGVLFSCQNGPRKFENCYWPKTNACRKNSDRACGASPGGSQSFPMWPGVWASRENTGFRLETLHKLLASFFDKR